MRSTTEKRKANSSNSISSSMLCDQTKFPFSKKKKEFKWFGIHSARNVIHLEKRFNIMIKIRYGNDELVFFSLFSLLLNNNILHARRNRRHSLEYIRKYSIWQIQWHICNHRTPIHSYALAFTAVKILLLFSCVLVLSVNAYKNRISYKKKVLIRPVSSNSNEEAKTTT